MSDNRSAESKTCAECRFWDRVKPEEYSAWQNHIEGEVSDEIEREHGRSPWGDDALEKKLEETVKERTVLWGECSRIKMKESSDKDDLAMLSDGSSYWAALATRGEFGCSLWEPTES